MIAQEYLHTDSMEELEQQLKNDPNIIYGSSKFAVAMEYLFDFANKYPELYCYTKMRGGILHTYVDEDNNAHILSVRELLELLPDNE